MGGLFCSVSIHPIPRDTENKASCPIILASGGWPTFGHKSYLVMRFATSYFHNTLSFITIHLNPSEPFFPMGIRKEILLGQKLKHNKSQWDV